MQCFTPVLMSEGKFISPGIYSGTVLQNCSIRSNYVNAVYRALFVEPLQIAWIGSLSNLSIVQNQFSNKRATFNQFIKAAHQPSSADIMNFFLPSTPEIDTIMDLRRNGFLLNLSRKEFIAQKSIFSSMKAVDALVLLTIVTEESVLKVDGLSFNDQMGRWAFDTLRLSNSVPSDFSEKVLK